MSERSPYDGRPYYCDACGLGFGEYLACELPLCILESDDSARKRVARISNVHPPRKGHGDEMSEMIERVAKAIREQATRLPEMSREDGNKFYAINLARAAISAMREPTPRMLRMLQLHIDHGSYAINAWKDTIDVSCEDESATPIPAEKDTVTK